jgi:hypothetical protein
MLSPSGLGRTPRPRHSRRSPFLPGHRSSVAGHLLASPCSCHLRGGGPWEGGWPCPSARIGSRGPFKNNAFRLLILDSDCLQARSCLAPVWWNCRVLTYLVEGGEVCSAVLVDVFWLVAENLSDEVVEDVGELPWDWELLDVLARHSCFVCNANLN